MIRIYGTMMCEDCVVCVERFTEKEILFLGFTND